MERLWRRLSPHRQRQCHPHVHPMQYTDAPKCWGNIFIISLRANAHQSQLRVPKNWQNIIFEDKISKYFVFLTSSPARDNHILECQHSDVPPTVSSSSPLPLKVFNLDRQGIGLKTSSLAPPCTMYHNTYSDQSMEHVLVWKRGSLQTW